MIGARHLTLAPALWLALTAIGCESSPTEIVVVVDTDLAVPGELDEVLIELDATGIGGGMGSSTVDLAAVRPAIVGLVHRDGPLGPIEVTATGRLDGSDIVTRRARVSFVSGSIQLLELHLFGICRSETCGASETCGRDGCRSIDHELREWPGEAPLIDGGTVEVDGGPNPIDGGPNPVDGGLDGGPGTTDAGCGVESCNGLDDDCDTLIDEDFDLATDNANCGACGRECTGACVARACDDAPLAMAVGLDHTCAATSTGGVACWGDNAAGQLGQGDTTARASPRPVAGPANVTTIGAGDNHSCAIDGVDGLLWCWGSDADGQISGGDALAPRTIGLAGSPSALALGGRHTCALVEGGVYCWGSDSNQQLGGSSRFIAATIGVSGVATAIAAGATHTCALLDDGSVWCWGDDSNGQVTGSAGGNEAPTQVLVSNAQAIGAGERHTCALMTNGTVQCWGSDANGQLGRGAAAGVSPPGLVSGIDDGIAIAVGARHSCVVRADGSAACWGDNTDQRLGDPATTIASARTPLTVTAERSLSRIAAGTRQTCARRGDLDMVCWGNGALGDGATTMSVVPVLVSLP